MIDDDDWRADMVALVRAMVIIWLALLIIVHVAVPLLVLIID